MRSSMFDSLSQRLEKAWDSVRKDGKLTADNIKNPLREIRRALLEADVRSFTHPMLQHSGRCTNSPTTSAHAASMPVCHAASARSVHAQHGDRGGMRCGLLVCNSSSFHRQHLAGLRACGASLGQ